MPTFYERQALEAFRKAYKDSGVRDFKSGWNAALDYALSLIEARKRDDKLALTGIDPVAQMKRAKLPDPPIRCGACHDDR